MNTPKSTNSIPQGIIKSSLDKDKYYLQFPWMNGKVSKSVTYVVYIYQVTPLYQAIKELRIPYEDTCYVGIKQILNAIMNSTNYRDSPNKKEKILNSIGIKVLDISF
ncbi:hypothetical protein HWC08_gp008 [Lactobacillus phage 521B]|uniref:Uncharacterized protein n=1 Tax=Lactobacillus phage 521B TaxID=2510942 RepID=A0A4Y5FG05_9CAUD|nr:hypothetical protein HWC08_gp008 [Lactobacillus phage 521B]QBJ03358.1 hypothetical protein B521_0008 [Lactobacillus phage 521B]